MRLLIVDDEPTTRESLRELIPWEQVGVTQVETARNGRDAMEKADKFAPDILLTDVRMPKMDGIALAEEIRSRFPECRIIFLSGYSDKDYLKAAINLNALRYIEKPIDPDEVALAVKQAVEQIRAAALQQEEYRAVCQATAGTQTLRRQEWLRGLMHLQAVSGAYPGTDTTHGADCVFTVTVSEHPEALSAEVPDAVAALLEPLVHSLVSVRNAASAWVLFGVLRPGVVPGQLRESLSAQPVPPFLTLGMAAGPLEEAALPELYHRACGLADTLFYAGSGRVLWDLPSRCAPLEVPDELWHAFASALRKDDATGARFHLGHLTALAQTAQDPDHLRVRHAFFRMLLLVTDVARDRGILDFSEARQPYIWHEFSSLTTLSGLQTCVSQHMDLIFSRAESRSHADAKTEEILKVMRENFHDPAFSLSALASRVYLSQTYLCAYFKKHTGRTINDVLTEIRMEQASQMLRDKNLRVSDIALRVGLADVNYFSTLFRKRYGTSPSEFREQYYL